MKQKLSTVMSLHSFCVEYLLSGNNINNSLMDKLFYNIEIRTKIKTF